MTRAKKQKMDFAGLRRRETYEEIINYLENEQEILKYPNRTAKFLRDSPYLTQLDGEGQRTMEEQQLNVMKQQEKDRILREMGYGGKGGGKGKSRAQREGGLEGPDPGEFFTPDADPLGGQVVPQGPQIFDMTANDDEEEGQAADHDPNARRSWSGMLMNGAMGTAGLATDIAIHGVLRPGWWAGNKFMDYVSDNQRSNDWSNPGRRSALDALMGFDPRFSFVGSSSSGDGGDGGDEDLRRPAPRLPEAGPEAEPRTPNILDIRPEEGRVIPAYLIDPETRTRMPLSYRLQHYGRRLLGRDSGRTLDPDRPGRVRTETHHWWGTGYE